MKQEGACSLLGFEDLWQRLKDLDETVDIEAKSGLGSAALETISAFANEPGRGGGYLPIGVAVAPMSGCSSTRPCPPRWRADLVRTY